MATGSGSAVDTLNILLLCGAMGTVGQGVRATIGLKNAGSLAGTTPSAQSTFSAAYFALSLMIGFIAGVVAGLASNFTRGATDFADPKVLLALAGSGYIGADFIENSLSLFISPGAKPTVPDASSSTGGSSGPTNAPQMFSASAPQALLSPAPDPSIALNAALAIVLPRVNTTIWTPALLVGFGKYDLSNSRRIAAAIGQFAVEAGAGFQELVENLNYSAERLVEVFPREFPNLDTTEGYAHDPERIANRVYSSRLGNGDADSGDGWRFRGRGLIQLTGREEYTEFGMTIGKNADEAATYCESVEGAAVSGCWYLASRSCLPLADAWQLSAITKKVNGSAMLGNAQRIAYSTDMLKHLGG